MDGAGLNVGSFGPPPPVKQVRDDVRRPVADGRPRGGKPRAAKPLGLIWSGLAGFVAGAICWHFVGFWGFMTEAVFYARPDGPTKGAVRAASAKNQSRQPGAAVASAAVANCLIAAMDRSGGEAQMRGCEGHTFKFHPSRNIVKADRGDFGPTPVPTLISGEGVGAVAVSGWSARIEAGDGAGTQGR